MSKRVSDIAEAATRLFLNQGYAKTQISHIAKAVGVSVGTIYNDFKGKKEIMNYILKSVIDPEFSERELETPISEDNFEGLEGQIIEALETSSKDFNASLEKGIADYGFKNMISDVFDIMSRYAVGCLFIEKNQYDFKLLAKRYREYRGKFFSSIGDYLISFMEKGEIRKIDNIELTTVLIIEMLSWWAMDMRYTSFEQIDISAETAKRICMDNLIAAYKA